MSLLVDVDLQISNRIPECSMNMHGTNQLCVRKSSRSIDSPVKRGLLFIQYMLHIGTGFTPLWMNFKSRVSCECLEKVEQIIDQKTLSSQTNRVLYIEHNGREMYATVLNLYMIAFTNIWQTSWKFNRKCMSNRAVWLNVSPIKRQRFELWCHADTLSRYKDVNNRLKFLTD